MALVVNTNVPSVTAQRYLTQSRNEMEQAMERLSSGKRINSAADDAAGLAISTRMETQISGLNVAIRNANDGISLIQTSEGAIGEVTDMLQRMRELALQSVHGVNSDNDRGALDAEVQALKAEIDRIASTTTFNGINLLDGSYNTNLQIGLNRSETLGVSIADLGTSSLGLSGDGDVVSSVSSNPSMVSGRVDLSGLTTSAGDVVIDGVALSAFSSGDDISDLTRIINEDVETVDAEAFNTFVAKEVGTGIALANKIVVKVAQIGTSSADADWQPEKEAYLAASSNMDELVQNINDAFDDNEIVASLNGDGKLVLSNSTGATISLVDTTGSTNGYDGATGFKVSASTALTAATAVSYASENVVTGFLQLQSVDGSPVSVDIGNKGLSEPGEVADLHAMGLQRVIEDPDGNTNQVLGGLFASATDITTAISVSSNGVADLIINDVEIYDQTLSGLSNTFQGKLDLINAFQDETGVVASAYFEKSFDFSSTDFVATNAFKLNGVSVSYGANLATMASNINVSTGTHGLTASVVGDNLILAGENVQNVNIDDVDYELSSSTIQAPARRAGDNASSTQALSIANADVSAGRTYTLTFGQAVSSVGVGGSSSPAGDVFQTANFSVEYTAASGDSATDVAEGLRDAVHARIAAHSTATGAATTAALADFNLFASATTGTLTFGVASKVGDRSITLSADPLTNKAFGGDQTLFGGIKLSSVSGDEISIELGEGHDAVSHNFKELNVGDTTWDKNTPTDLVSVSPAVSRVSGISIATSGSADEAMGVIDAALQQISDTRSNLGAVENRLSHTVSNLSNVVENTAAAQSRIQDADFALEAAALARAQILQQAGTAMLAQANAAPQNVLSLLG